MREIALTTVQHVVTLKLSSEQRNQVAEIIEAAVSAVAADDQARLRQAVSELMAVEPMRVTKGDGKTIISTEKRIFERANFLVGMLQPMRPEPSDKPNGDGQ